MKTQNRIMKRLDSLTSLFTEEHMRFRKAVKALSLMILASIVALATACSSQGDRTPFFQNNSGSYPISGGDDPFAGLPDGLDPSVLESPVALIGELFNPGSFNLDITATDYQIFEDNMAKIRDHNQLAVREVLLKMKDLSSDPTCGVTGHGMYGLMAALRDIMKYIINQDDYSSPNDGHSTYITELYDFLDRVNEADLGVKDDVYEILFKNLRYINETYTANDINNIMNDLNSFLSDSTGQNVSSLLLNLQEGLGKMLMRADTNIAYDDPADFDGSGTNDIGLGNAVAGVDLLLRAVNNMVSDNNELDAVGVRGDLYGILREAGRLTNAGGFNNRIKQLLCNIEDYYTVGGRVYDPAGANYNPAYNSNGGTPYVNAELRNTLKELWPGLVKLFIRENGSGLDADDPYTSPDYSIIHQTNGDRTRSPIEWLTRALYRLKEVGIDYSQSTYAMEPSLKRMVEYNGFGTTRAGQTNYLKVSYLDHLLYTIAGSYNFGFLTRSSVSGEPYANTLESGSYGHGAATKGILTTNDCLYSMTTHNKDVTVVFTLATLDSYGLALAHRTSQGAHVWRRSASTNGFTYNDANKNDYRFYLGYDYPPLLLLPESCAGDAGIPNGGQMAMDDPPDSDATTPSRVGSPNRNDYRTYYPKVADGKGMMNTAAFVMSWISRACWDGAGPYYSTAGATTNSFNWPGKGTRTVNVYYKPNGEVYAYVFKGATPWEYYYPTSATTGIGNDVVDSGTGANGQRFNRYRDICKSDYFMVEAGDDTGKFCSPPMNPNSTSYVDSTTGAGRYRLNSGNNAAQCFWLYEKVQELTNDNINVGDNPYQVIGNINRECATQEEAMYRNYQWLMLEKKFMFPIPMNIATTIAGCVEVDVCAFVVIEANGVVGLTNARKNGSGLAYWNIRGSEGLGTHNNYPAGRKNLIDYGDSLRPGDSRILPFAKYFSSMGNDMSPEVIYNDILGPGHVMPNAVGANIGPIARLGFLESSFVTSNFSLGSDSWTNRNKILPIFAALAGSLMDGSYYDTTGVTNHDYNWNSGARHKYPLLDLLEGVMMPLAKPMFRYYSAFGGRWVPRMEDEDINNSGGGSYTDEYSFFMPDIYSDARDPNYYPRNGVRMLTSFLAGNSDNTVDGILPLLTDTTTLVSRLLSLLQRLGNNSTDSPYGDSNGGGLNILADFSTGLEQIVTSFQVGMGETTANGYTWLDKDRHDTALSTSRYSWMFTGGGSPRAVFTQDCDFGGYNVSLPPGTYTRAQIIANGISDNDVSSLHVPAGYRVTLYDGDNYTGTTLVFNGDVDINCLVDYGFNDRMTSVRIESTLTLADRRTSGSPVSVDLDVALDQLIGYSNVAGTTGQGLARFVDDRGGTYDAAGWANYDRLFNAMAAMMGNPGGAYYILDDASNSGTAGVIGIMNKMLTGVTADDTDLKALRHTLGVLMARNDGGTWKPQASSPLDSELYMILHQYTPEILNAYNRPPINEYHYLLTALYELFEDQDDPNTLYTGNVNYLLDLLVPAKDPSAIIPKVYELLNRDAMTDSSYYGSSYPTHATLQELADICEELAAGITIP